ATRAGQAFAVVAAVTRGPTLSGRVEPPAWREPTVARAAGRWVGSLMGAGGTPADRFDRATREAVSAAVREIVTGLA
ncbi:MAG: hypothetical protein AAF805_14535, partial [Planctomycetota bacterium]